MDGGFQPKLNKNKVIILIIIINVGEIALNVQSLKNG